MPPHASHYTDKYVPGARLPHAWISFKEAQTPGLFRPLDVSYVKEWTEKDVSARQASTLDLCPYDSFTLIIGDRQAWEQRFKHLQKSLADTFKIRLWSVNEDFGFAFPEQEKQFRQGFGLDSGGGVLVRPDQHILAVLDEASFLEGHIYNHLRR